MSEKLGRKIGRDRVVELDPALSLLERNFVLGHFPNMGCDPAVTKRLFYVALLQTELNLTSSRPSWAFQPRSHVSWPASGGGDAPPAVSTRPSTAPGTVPRARS